MKITPLALINVILATVLLTSVFFMNTTLTTSRSGNDVKATGASSYSATNTNGYDPWIDTNHDGTIDIYDIIAVASRFGTSGDPALNVTVTNFPSPKLQYETVFLGQFNITSGRYISFFIPTDLNNPVFCGGYSKLSVMYQPIFYSNTLNFTLYLSAIGWWTEAFSHYVPHSIRTYDYTYLSNCTLALPRIYLPEPALVDVKAPYFSLVFTTKTDSPNWMNMWVVIDVWVYLRSD